MTSIPLSQLESSPSAKFEKFGDTYKGKIVGMTEQQQTDTNSNPLFFSNGVPRMQWLITIEQANGDAVVLYAKPGKFTPAEGTGESMGSAIGTAARAAGASGVDMGAELAVSYTGRATPTPGKAAAKLYTAQYRPAAAATIPVNMFSDES